MYAGPRARRSSAARTAGARRPSGPAAVNCPQSAAGRPKYSRRAVLCHSARTAPGPGRCIRKRGRSDRTYHDGNGDDQRLVEAHLYLPPQRFTDGDGGLAAPRWARVPRVAAEPRTGSGLQAASVE